MSFFKEISLRYQKFCGTAEKHRDERLKTRYYKASFNQVFQTVEQLLKDDPSGKISSISKEHGEISAEIGRSASFMTVTVVMTKPFETAVDLHISTERFSLAGINPLLKKEILYFYQKLDQSLPFIGSGINGNE
ncbi:hypothetical protein [Bacillus sp. REN3]|uniref:hypothetical protein n=1 Tax=Bacillus sp. REN3 TaxID=2802440 RepID=UPI001AEF08FB|nr:hypothetical protein [Bacillus sp. REN3]